MNNENLLINLLIAFGALQAIFMCIIFLKPGTQSIFKNLFATLLIIEAITLLERLLVESGLINSVPHLLGISYPISFIKPPLMFFMTLSLTQRNFNLRSRSLVHLTPFILILAMNIPVYLLSGEEKLQWVKQFMEKVPSYKRFDFYFTLSFFLYIGIYILLSIRKLFAFRRFIRNNILVNWYWKLLIIYIVFLFIHFIYFLLQPITQLNLAYFNQVSMLIMAFMVQTVAYVLIAKSSETNRVDIPDDQNFQKLESDWHKVLHKIEKDKLYLDDELTLKKFSDSISLPEKYVSQIINGKLNCSFKRLINQYRVEEAKRIMINSKEAKLKLFDVGNRSGFNNKVSFYRVFKEFENMSPSDFISEKRKK